MSFMRQNHNSAYVWRYTGLQIQTSSAAVPIQIVYGANKLAPNVVWTGGFQSWGVKAKGGKGGGAPSSYDYKAGFILGLCEGPINAVGGVWKDQGITYTWNLGLSVFHGYTPQTPWGFLSAFYPYEALPYGGLAYVATGQMDLGSSPNLPTLAFDVHGLLVGTGMLNPWDASPALCIQDILTSSQYGANFPAASLDSTTLLGGSGGSSYQAYCIAAGFAISPVLSNKESASSILTRWLRLTNTAAVWSGGKLKFIPYGDSTITNYNAVGGAVTFVPNVTPIYNLTDDDFIHEDGKDPLEVVRSDPYLAKNWLALEFLDRNNWYDASPLAAWDQNAIELYGLRIDPSIPASEVCQGYIAQAMAQTMLQRNLYIRNTYNFKLSFEYCLLEPMDLVTLTDPGLGMTNVAARITSIEEDDAGILSVTAEEFPGGTATSVTYTVQGGAATFLNHEVTPSAVNTPLIFEPPSTLTNGVAEVWCAVSGGLAPVHKLAEDGSTGVHATNQSMASQASGTSIVLSVAVQAVERTACRLNGNNGSAAVGVDFNLTAGLAGTPDALITDYSITPLGSGWFQLSISFDMAATAAPAFEIRLESPFLTQSYAGTIGDGVYIWGASFSAGGEPLAMLPAFTGFTGSTLTSAAVATPEGAIGAADPYWGGAYVYLSTDGSTYEQIGQVNGPSRQGVLASSIAAPSARPDVTNTLAVNLVESGGALASGTTADAQNAVTLCIVDNELLAYETATLVSGNTYDLTYLERGLYGSAATSHASNAPFARLDGLIFQYPLPAAFIGVPLYLKFASFNIFGLAAQDLSTCVAYAYTPTGAGIVGPVAQALLIGTNLDYGLASAGVNEADDFGLASDPYVTTIDLGLASS